MKRKLLLLVCTLFMMGALLPARAGNAAEGWLLTVNASDNTIPDSFKQTETGRFGIALTNSGTAAFAGYLAWLLLDPETDKMVYTDNNFANRGGSPIQPGEEAILAVPYEMINVPAGTYKLSICAVELEGPVGDQHITAYTPLPMTDGTTGKTVQVMETPRPKVHFVEGAVRFTAKLPGNENVPVLWWGNRYIIIAELSVTGGDFAGDLSAVLLKPDETGDGYVIQHRSNPSLLSLNEDATGECHFSGSIDATLQLGMYMFAFVDENDQLILSENGKPIQVSVGYPLSIGSNSQLPTTIKQNEDGTLVLAVNSHCNEDITNAQLYMAFADGQKGKFRLMGSKDFSVQAQGSMQVNIPYNIGDFPAGQAEMLIGYLVDGEFFIVPIEPSLIPAHPVTVEANEGPKMSYIAAESTLPTQVTQHSGFTAEVVLRNEGAPFDRDVHLGFVNNAGEVVYAGTATSVTLQRDETKTVTLSGTMDMELTQPRPVAYFVRILYSDNSGWKTIAPDDGLMDDVLIVLPDPATNAVLSWLTADTQLPDAFVIGQSHTLSLPVANTGKADYTGEVDIILTQDGTSYPASTRLGETTFAAESTTTLTGTLTLPADMEPGDYRMRIVVQTEGGDRFFIPTEDLLYDVPVTVTKPATGLSGTQARTVLYPNPATDHVTVASGEGIVQVCAYTVTGALMARETADGATQCTLRTDAWPQGVYVLEITTPQGVHTQRLVKE